MQIAIYSGSFNPIHNGHLAIAQAALSAGSAEVWLVVSPQNPHKHESDLWPFEERLSMTDLAVKPIPGLKCSDCEKELPLPSYTIQTLRHLQHRYPEHRFRLLIGEDNLQKFHLWKDYQSILDNFGLIVYPRVGGQITTEGMHANITWIDAPLLDISSSQIRCLLSEKQPIDGLVPAQVAEFIRQKLKRDEVCPPESSKL